MISSPNDPKRIETSTNKPKDIVFIEEQKKNENISNTPIPTARMVRIVKN